MRFAASVAILAGPVLVGASCRARTPREFLSGPVAHALGGIEGHTYTNSLEAWRLNYAQGCRFFEVDLWITSDQRLVAFHGEAKGFAGLPRDFTLPQFLRSKILNRFTPLDSQGLAGLLAEKRDWTLITDTKSDLRKSLELLCGSLAKKGLSCARRVIPQIYQPDQLGLVEKLGFSRVILTLYLNRMEDESVFRFASRHPSIVAVTMPHGRAIGPLPRKLSEAGIGSFVHTINGAKAIRSYLDRGISGVYTDFDCREPSFGGSPSGIPERPLKTRKG